MEDSNVSFHVILSGFLSGGQGEDSQSKQQSFCVNKVCRLYLWLLHGLIRLICHIKVAGEVISAEVREVIKASRGFQACATWPPVTAHWTGQARDVMENSDKGRKRSQAFILKHLSPVSLLCVFVFDPACKSRKMSRVIMLILTSLCHRCHILLVYLCICPLNVEYWHVEHQNRS